MNLHPSRPLPPTAAAQEETAAQALYNCARAKEFEEAGRYAEAAESLGEFWGGVGVRPPVEGLAPEAAAEVLLRVGSISGWLGSLRQEAGAQEAAKDLISEAATRFASLGDVSKEAEARVSLGVCYWREGALDEARVVLRDARERAAGRDAEQEARALLGMAMVERRATRYREALETLREAAPLFEATGSHTHKARFHIQLGTVLENIARTERRREYFDDALLEYTAASFHCELAGHVGFLAAVENNIGFLFYTLGKYTEAREHLSRALELAEQEGDAGRAAQFEDTLARVLLAEGRAEDAELFSGSSVRRLEGGGELSFLSEALTTRGRALARLGRPREAEEALRRAASVAEQSGDLEGAGQSLLTLCEELGERLGDAERRTLYARADQLLTKTGDAEILTRLRAVARTLIARPPAAHTPPGVAVEAATDAPRAEAPGDGAPMKWDGFSLKEEVRRIERGFIERALRESDGMVSRASRLLGFRHHESLTSLLKSRHKDLLAVRTPAKPRRRSIIRKR
jgi:tetratricopeptide (TPR) repeat protein